MKFRVHMYRISQKYEFVIEAETSKESLNKASEILNKTENPGEFLTKLESDFIGMAFPDKKEEGDREEEKKEEEKKEEEKI
jgi:hypothetical protein